MIHFPHKSIEEIHSFLEVVSAEWQKKEPSYYEFAIVYDSVHIGAVCVYLNEDRTEGELGWILNKNIGEGDLLLKLRLQLSHLHQSVKSEKTACPL